MMKKTIYLHIGSGKTGTTSIQYMLYKNKESLLDNNTLYYTKDFTPEPNHHYLITTPYSNDIWNKDREKYQELKEVFEQSSASKMIISTEKIMGVPKYYLKEIQQLFGVFEVKIIAYIRNQIELIPSHYLQRQKDLFADYKGNIENFFHSYKMGWGNEHALVLDNWLPVFGKSNILILVYDRALLEEGDVCLDFAKVLGISQYVKQDKTLSNISLIPEVSALVGVLDSGLPMLSNKASPYFSEIRQQAIMGPLLRISKGANRNDIAIINECLDAIAQVVHKNFPNIKTHTLYKIFTEIERTRQVLRAKEKISLIGSELQAEILEFYKKSNLRFAETFLDERQAKYFLKYYEQI